MQADSSDKIINPSLQHNPDATQLKGTGEEQQSKISHGKSSPAFIQRKVTGYLVLLQSHFQKEIARAISGSHEDF